MSKQHETRGKKRSMRASNKSVRKSANQQYEDFAKKNEAWDHRVKSAVAELDKAASKAKRAARAAAFVRRSHSKGKAVRLDELADSNPGVDKEQVREVALMVSMLRRHGIPGPTYGIVSPYYDHLKLRGRAGPRARRMT